MVRGTPSCWASAGVTDWTDGQRFVSGWIGSRLASGFAVRKVEPRRERVPIRREAGQLVAVNGLGCTIKRLLVADEQGVIHVAQDIAAGKEVVLTRTAGVASTTAKDPATLLGEPESWSTYVSRLSAKPADVLRPGMYVAIVSRSPFIEAAVPKPTKYTSDAVIIGLLKGIGDAG